MFDALARLPFWLAVLIVLLGGGLLWTLVTIRLLAIALTMWGLG